MTEIVAIYDDETHTYQYAGRKLLSVTGVISGAGLLGDLIGDEHALWRGTAVHKAVELYVAGTLDPESVDPSIQPYLNAYIEFEKATGFKATETEKPYFNAPLGIACKPDLVGHFPNGAEAIVELKSGALSPWVRLQTAGQDLTLGNRVTRLRYALSIPATGKPKVLQHRDPNDYRVFLACVTLANWKNEVKLGGQK